MAIVSFDDNTQRSNAPTAETRWKENFQRFSTIFDTFVFKITDIVGIKKYLLLVGMRIGSL